MNYQVLLKVEKDPITFTCNSVTYNSGLICGINSSNVLLWAVPISDVKWIKSV